MKEAFIYFTIILLLVSCNRDKQSASDEMPSLYPAPQTVALNTEEGYIINQVTGDTIQPLINSQGDTIKTGVPVPAKGKVIYPDSVAQPKIIPAGEPKVVPTNLNVHKIPEALTVIPVNKDSLRTFTPGVNTSSFILVNLAGDTVPTGVPIPVKGKVVPCIQPQPFKALPLRMKDNASINIQYLDVSQGMSSSLVTSILEDSNSNLWFGMWGGGVSMYNGETFTHFTQEVGLSSNFVLSILEDSHGNLWFGTYGGGLSMYNGENFTHFTLIEGLFDFSVYSILEDSHGNLWFGTSGGVSMYSGETFMHFTEKEGLSSNYIYSILEDSHGNLWFGTWEGGVSMYNGESFTHFTEKVGLSNNNVRSILEDSHGNLWFGTSGGVTMYNGESFTHFTEKEGLSNNIVLSILEDSQGNLWFGTYGGGVSKLDGESFTHFTEKVGLSNNNVRSILEDRHGNLWFGTNGGGVCMYNSESFMHFTEKEGLINSKVRSILEDSHGNLWFGTSGGVSMYNGKSFTYFTQKEGFCYNRVNSTLADSYGNLWFGTEGRGVIKYNGYTFTHYTEKEGLSSNYIYSILEDSHGNLWFGTWEGGVSMYNGESFTHFTEKEGLSNNIVLSILEDSHGNLWFGTYGGGVSKLDGETFTHFTEKEGLSSICIYSILEDNHGNLWFGTEDGVSMYNFESFTYFTKNEGLSDNRVYSVLEDSERNIWLSTQKGLNCLVFRPESISGIESSLSASGMKEEKAKVTFHNPVIHTFGLQDGLKSPNFNIMTGFIDSKNRIWWGSIKSLVMFDMNKFKIPDKLPSMQLNRIDINGQFADYHNLKESAGMEMGFNGVAKFNNYPLNLELPYNRNHLTFHFSAIDWSAPHKIKYSYKMEGLNANWSLPKSEAKADYRNLPYGNYTFKVCAIGVAQKWSEPFEYTFTILPPWWHTWWARTGYGFTALLLIFGFVRWRTAKLRKRQIELEQTVKDRTVEISDKNEELNQQNFQIREQKQAITDSIQYASRIQTAILPPDEVLKYLLPKHFILYKPRDIVSGDFYWLTQKREKIIIVVADCTGHGVPGAFMSMLGNALLNDIVNNIKTLQANFILNELRDQVMVSLRQTGKTDEAKDGMDIALCILDKENMAIQYAGGFNSLYLIRNGKLTEIKADKMPIGISSKAGKSFTNNELTLQKDDTLYMSSDGYIDQFGGPKGKKFMSTRFKQLLLDIQDKIMFEQKEILEQTLNEWMGFTGLHEEEYEQIDDIIVMGIKI